jgi:cellulose biosynthesis protein BcsQ
MSLEEVLNFLPQDASEAVVESNFSKALLKALGFEDQEMVPGFKVGNLAVDHAARKNQGSDIFLHTLQNPYLYMEVKGRSENLGDENSPKYKSTALQLKRYLQHPASASVKWGLLTNSFHIQLFRKHGKVVHPVTPILALDGNVDTVVKDIKQRIENPKRALTVAVYNNKGGVGKTTTTLNLAATLAMGKKRVLIIDFDPNQSDLGDALNFPPLDGEVLETLFYNHDIRKIIKTYEFKNTSLKEPISFDIILADRKFGLELTERDLSVKLKLHDLRKALKSVWNDYDYIFIDSPPNWRIFAQKAIYAADVVLLPARHDNLNSLQNAGTAITKFIPEIQTERQKNEQEAGPIALPIFMNSAFKETGAQIQMMHKAIARIILDTRKNTSDTPGFDLTPYFYPKYRASHKDLSIMSIPYMAYISKSDFQHMPAAFAFKAAREQYVNLIREYFL